LQCTTGAVRNRRVICAELQMAMGAA